jgi:hypothetical protein
VRSFFVSGCGVFSGTAAVCLVVTGGAFGTAVFCLPFVLPAYRVADRAFGIALIEPALRSCLVLPFAFGHSVSTEVPSALLPSFACFVFHHPAKQKGSFTLLVWQARRESNPQPAVLETAALPIELLAYHKITSI